jgi:hypothetical protein
MVDQRRRRHPWQVGSQAKADGEPFTVRRTFDERSSGDWSKNRPRQKNGQPGQEEFDIDLGHGQE